MATELDSDELLYLCQGHETTEKKVYFQNTDTKSARASVVGINQAKVPHWVQSTFLYTISGVQFLLELKHSEIKTSRSIADRLWETFFMSVCPKMNVLEGEEKIRGRKENIKREKSIIQECKPIKHHSQIQ